MTKCDYCGFQSDEPKGYRRNYCDSCVPDKEIGIPQVKEYILIGDGYKTTRARLDELERRRILPYEHPDKNDYYVGRMGENGKVQEREPDYR